MTVDQFLLDFKTKEAFRQKNWHGSFTLPHDYIINNSITIKTRAFKQKMNLQKSDNTLKSYGWKRFKNILLWLWETYLKYEHNCVSTNKSYLFQKHIQILGLDSIFTWLEWLTWPWAEINTLKARQYFKHRMTTLLVMVVKWKHFFFQIQQHQEKKRKTKKEKKIRAHLEKLQLNSH